MNEFGSRRFSAVKERMYLVVETLLDKKKGYVTDIDRAMIECIVHAFVAEMLLMGFIEADRPKSGDE